MLPFLLKNKPQVAGVIVKQRQPGGSIEESNEQMDDADAGELACARDAMDAIEKKDAKAFASALRSLFEIMDSQPHEEGEHTNDYDSMNAKAAKESE